MFSVDKKKNNIFTIFVFPFFGGKQTLKIETSKQRKQNFVSRLPDKLNNKAAIVNN